MFVVSKSTIISPRSGNEVPSPTHSFDAGIASGYVALQASIMGWFVHGMAGFEQERAFTELAVPKGYNIEAVFALWTRVQAMAGECYSAAASAHGCDGNVSTQSSTGGFQYPGSYILTPTLASPLTILRKSRMRRRARTDLSGRRPVKAVPTGTRTKLGVRTTSREADFGSNPGRTCNEQKTAPLSRSCSIESIGCGILAGINAAQ